MDHWQKKKGMTTSEIAMDVKISCRRVQWIWKCYASTGIEPVIGINPGRPKKPFDFHEPQIIKEAYARYQFGARMLEGIIRKLYRTCISHNHIHMYLKAEGLSHEDLNKKKRRKWIRYVSRMILTSGEFTAINSKNSKKLLIG